MLVVVAQIYSTMIPKNSWKVGTRTSVNSGKFFAAFSNLISAGEWEKKNDKLIFQIKGLPKVKSETNPTPSQVLSTSSSRK